MSLSDNFIIRKKLPIKLKQQPENIIIRKKIKLKLKSHEITPPPIQQKSTNNVEQKYKKPQITLKKSPMDQLNNYLDEKFKHHLMFIKDSWTEVKHKIRLDSNGQECWWDLELLLKHFAEQLNISCMANPSPQWPSNPFNRHPFDKSQLLLLGKQIKELKIPVNYMVKELFNYLQTKFRYLPIDKFTATFIGYVSSNYRYRHVNYKDSQSNYVGYWIKKTEPLTLFEERYNELKLIPPGEYDEENDRIIETEEYAFYKDILNTMPAETIDLDNNAMETF